MVFLRVLFIAIVILTLLRLAITRLLPWALRRFARKMQEKAFGASQQTPHDFYQRRPQAPKAEGKINIDYVPPQPKPSPGAQNAGEFVDFEEIPDK
jgi:hypothetical protein